LLEKSNAEKDENRISKSRFSHAAKTLLPASTFAARKIDQKRKRRNELGRKRITKLFECVGKNICVKKNFI
jgi:hypothetical protein